MRCNEGSEAQIGHGQSRHHCKGDGLTLPHVPGPCPVTAAHRGHASDRLAPPSLSQGHPSLLTPPLQGPEQRLLLQEPFQAIPCSCLGSGHRVSIKHRGEWGALCTPPHTHAQQCPWLPTAPALMVPPSGKGPVILPSPDGLPPAPIPSQGPGDPHHGHRCPRAGWTQKANH